MQSSDNSVPIAVVDDSTIDLISQDIFPFTEHYLDMMNASYNGTLTFSTVPSWSGSYLFDGTYTRVAVYICVPPAPIDTMGAAFATYIIDGTQVGASYVPFASRDLFVPRFAHFVSGLMLAIPGGTHNLTIQASGNPGHPYLLDYIVLYDQYLGPDHPYPGSPTYVSSLSASRSPTTSATSTTTTAGSEPPASQPSGPLTLSTTSLSEAPTTSTGLDALPSASFQPSPKAPVRTYIAGAVLGGVAATAVLFAVSYAMYRRHRKHGRRTPLSPDDNPNGSSSRSSDSSQPLMAEAETLPAMIGPLRASESHPYDVPTTTAEGLYSTLVRHQTGKGKVKEIRLQPSRTSLDASYESMRDSSTVSAVLFEDGSPDNLPLYCSSSAQASESGEQE